MSGFEQFTGGNNTGGMFQDQYNADFGDATGPANAAPAAGGGGGKGAGIAGGAVDAAMGAYGAFAPMVDDINMESRDRMNRKGDLTHDANVGGKAMSGAAAGAKIGTMFGPWGTLIGGAAGGIAGGILGMVDKNQQPDKSELADRRDIFEMENQVGTIKNEDMFGQQQLMAANGMDVTGNTKQIEVERDEIVLRKVGKGFKKVADFKGGKPHEMGGEQFTAQEGDIIFPGKDRRRITNLVNNRRWTAIESARQQLPTDTPDGTAKKGLNHTNVLRTPQHIEKFKMLNDMYPNGTAGIVAPGMEPDPPLKTSLRQLDKVNRTDAEINALYTNNPNDAINQAKQVPDMTMGQYGKFFQQDGRSATGSVDNVYNISQKGKHYNDQAFKENIWPALQTLNPGVSVNYGGKLYNASAQNKYAPPATYPNGTSGILGDPTKPGTNTAMKQADGSVLLNDQVTLNQVGQDAIFRKPFVQDVNNASVGQYGGSYADKEGFETKGPGLYRADGDIITATKAGAYNQADTIKNMERFQAMPGNENRQLIYQDAQGKQPYRKYSAAGYAKGTSGIKMYAEGTDGVKTEGTAGGLTPAGVKFLAQPGVRERVEAIAEKNGFSVSQLLNVFRLESGFKTTARNKDSNATGLIQWMPNVAKEYGTTIDELKGMDVLEQLDYVDKYYDKKHTPGMDPYITVAFPGHAGKPDDFVIAKKGSKRANAIIAQNPGWVGEDGTVTMGSINKFSGENQAQDPSAGAGVIEDAAKEEEIAVAEATQTPEDRGYWSAADSKGQMAAATRGDINALGVNMPDFLNIKTRTSNLIGDAQDVLGFDRSIPEINHQEVGFSDPALAQQADNFISYLQHDADITWAAADVMRTASAAQNKLLTGQDFEGGIPNAISEILSGENPEDVEKWIADAKAKGIIDDKGDAFVRDVVTNPDNFWTTDMKVNMGADVATLIANPKGAWNVLKGGVKVGKTILTASAWKKAILAAKKLPGAMKKIGVNIAKSLETEYKYTGGESLDELIAMGKKLDADGIKPPTGESFELSFTGIKNSLKNVPDNLRQKLVGKSYSELNAMKTEVEELTGVPANKLAKMSKREVGVLFNKKLIAAEDAVKTSIVKKEAAWEAYKPASAEFKVATKALKEAKAGAASPEVIAKLEADVENSTKMLAGVTRNLESVYADKAAYDKNWSEIARLEKFSGTEEFKSSWRVLEDLEKGVTRHLDNLDDLGDVPESIKALKNNQKVWSDGLSSSVAKSKSATDSAADVTTAESRIAKAQAARDSGLKAGRDANLGIGQAKTAQAGVMEKLAKAPKLLALLEKDAVAMKAVKSGSLTGVQLANYLRQRGGDAVELETLETPEELSGYKFQDNPFGTELEKEPDFMKALDPGKFSEVMQVDQGQEAVVEDEAETPAGADKETTPEQPGKESIAAQAGNVLSNLSAYAPAIYNMVKGSEKPGKTMRNYSNPIMQAYENRSQGADNAIEQAFQGRLANARNTSGGSMSNFRANAEQAWANKVREQSQVNEMEAGRADQVAKYNVDQLNQADRMNTEIDNRADIQDEQNISATNAFTAQGVQDIANISAMHRKDANAKENENMIREMIQANRPWS